MLKVGDKAIVRTDDSGHFYAGKHVIVLKILPDPYRPKIGTPKLTYKK